MLRYIRRVTKFLFDGILFLVCWVIIVTIIIGLICTIIGL